jgi:hypothetical protein
MSGDGTVSLEELIYGVGRLKGPARSLDVESRQQNKSREDGFVEMKAPHILYLFFDEFQNI